MLMKIKEFQGRFSPESRPDRRTVVRWIEEGEVYGVQIGKIWYVDPDRSPATSGLRPLTERVLAQ